MREIKFRAWEKQLKEIIPVYDINFESEIINNDGAWRTLKEVELMQYTGLKDKNGVEIYEGDIVKPHGKGFADVIEVRWFSDDEIVGWNLFDDTDKVVYEVIGNIYENPELLEGKELK